MHISKPFLPRRSITTRRVLCAVASLLLLAVVTSCSSGTSSTVSRPTATAPQSTPVHGTLFLSTASAAGGGLPKGTAYALSLADGSTRWQNQTGPIFGGVLAGSSLVVSVGNISGTPPATKIDSTLEALDASTGGVRWQKKQASSLVLPLAATADVAFVSATTATANTSQPPPSTLQAFRAIDGTVLWTAPQQGQISTRVTVGDGALYVTTHASAPPSFTLSALDASTGKERWHLALQNLPAGPYEPQLSEGVLYLAEQYFQAPGQLDPTSVILAVRASDGTVLWHTTPPVPGAASSLVVSNGTIGYLYSAVNGPGGGIVALHAADGSLAWQTTSVQGAGSVPLIQDNGVIYATEFRSTSATSMSQVLHAYDAATGKTSFERPLPSLPVPIIPTPSAAPPQLVGGVIYTIAQGTKPEVGTPTGDPQSLAEVFAVNVSDGSLKWSGTLETGYPGTFLLVAP